VIFFLKLAGMKKPLHAWNLTPEKASAVQRALRQRLRLEPLAEKPLTVAGIDVGYTKGQKVARGAIVVLSYPDLAVLDTSMVEAPVSFPYVPGLLSFREAPVILKAWERLTVIPEVLIFDGHGWAHPRRFGLACHVGLWLDRPSIGCAKSILVGVMGSLEDPRGSTASISHGGEEIGIALRTRQGVKPVYVSAGHRVDHASAVWIVLGCGGGYRMPEPVRLADKISKRGKGCCSPR
jgi:deoxyribonuclease V